VIISTAATLLLTAAGTLHYARLFYDAQLQLTEAFIPVFVLIHAYIVHMSMSNRAGDIVVMVVVTM
jgi:hypothetical protein